MKYQFKKQFRWATDGIKIIEYLPNRDYVELPDRVIEIATMQNILVSIPNPVIQGQEPDSVKEKIIPSPETKAPLETEKEKKKKR